MQNVKSQNSTNDTTIAEQWTSLRVRSTRNTKAEESTALFLVHLSSMLVSTAAAACWWRRDNWGNHAFGYERHWHNRRGNAGDRTAPLSFLSRVSTLLRDIDIAILSVVRPSVRDVPVLDVKRHRQSY